jgi:hypothetical protein
VGHLCCCVPGLAGEPPACPRRWNWLPPSCCMLTAGRCWVDADQSPDQRFCWWGGRGGSFSTHFQARSSAIPSTKKRLLWCGEPSPPAFPLIYRTCNICRIPVASSFQLQPCSSLDSIKPARVLTCVENQTVCAIPRAGGQQRHRLPPGNHFPALAPLIPALSMYATAALARMRPPPET